MNFLVTIIDRNISYRTRNAFAGRGVGFCRNDFYCYCRVVAKFLLQPGNNNFKFHASQSLRLALSTSLKQILAIGPSGPCSDPILCRLRRTSRSILPDIPEPSVVAASRERVCWSGLEYDRNACKNAREFFHRT